MMPFMPLAPWRHFVPAFLLLAATAFFLQCRHAIETIPPHRSLSLFPHVIADWTGEDYPLSAEELSVLGSGDFLTRDYRQPDGTIVNLLVAYYSSQRSGDTIHSPKNCLPGAGWQPTDATTLAIERPGNAPAEVNRYILANGPDRALVLYWYQAHGRIIATEYGAKLRLISDALRLNRTDGALVRIVTALAPSENARDAESRAAGFAQKILPVLDSYIPL